MRRSTTVLVNHGPVTRAKSDPKGCGEFANSWSKANVPVRLGSFTRSQTRPGSMEHHILVDIPAASHTHTHSRTHTSWWMLLRYDVSHIYTSR